MIKRNKKEYKLVGEKPVARFFYNGHHSHPVRRTVLIIQDNENLMMENSILRLINKKQGLILNHQQLHIRDLEKFKEAILKGNYTQNENENIREGSSQMVVER